MSGPTDPMSPVGNVTPRQSYCGSCGDPPASTLEVLGCKLVKGAVRTFTTTRPVKETPKSHDDFQCSSCDRTLVSIFFQYFRTVSLVQPLIFCRSKSKRVECTGVRTTGMCPLPLHAFFLGFTSCSRGCVLGQARSVNWKP